MTMPTNLDPKPGIYKGRAVEGSEQYSESVNGNPELLIDLVLPELANRRLTTVLYFTGEATPYSLVRLRALGWEGDDLQNLKGIGKNEVGIEIKYNLYEGSWKMKVEIMSGAGKFTASKPQDKSAWAAKVGAITGMASGSGGPPKAPF